MTDVHQPGHPTAMPGSPMLQATGDGVPFWARQSGILIIVGAWAAVHAFIAVFMEGAINLDDATESYLSQSLEAAYVGRNPPLFNWLLYGLQKIVGTGPLGFALLRYVPLFLCAFLVYRIARQLIVDPRLQALAVYSLSAIWVIGFHSHRILTHSNLMIVAIAGVFLTLLVLVRRPSLGQYAALGLWSILGLMSQFGFAAFLAVLTLACLLEPTFRRALLDRRIVITLIIAALPILAYGVALNHSGNAPPQVMADFLSGSGAGPDRVLASYVAALFGYALPLVALVAFIFLPWNRGDRALAEPQEERAAARRVLRWFIVIGVLALLISSLVAGTDSVRDRNLHVFLLLLPVYLFAELERLGGWHPRVNYYLGALGALALIVVVVRVLVQLWPHPALCGRCLPAEPLYKISAPILMGLGPAPTLVADDRASAGRLRAAVPGARVVIAAEFEYHPPARQATGCARVTGIANGLPVLLPAPHRDTMEMSIKWPAPLMKPPRLSDWQVTPLPKDDPLCR